MPADVDWSSARVLVTGASGFIGTRLVETLVRGGAKVHASSRQAPAAAGEGLTWHTGDLSDAGVASAMVRSARPDFVFHLASRVTGSQDLAAVLPTLHANLITTVNLLVAATEHGKPRFVTAGSLVEPRDRSQGITPSSPYAAGKWASGDYLRMFHSLYGLPASVARIFMVYGPGQRDTTKLVPYTVLCALRGEAPACGSGDRLVDWIYVDDVVEGLLALAATSETAGTAVDLGSGVLVSIRDVTQEIIHQVGSEVDPRFGARPDPKMEPVVVADTEGTKRRIGWSPRVTMADGLGRTISWYQERESVQRGA